MQEKRNSPSENFKVDLSKVVKVERFLENNCVLEEGKVDVEKEIEFIKNN